MEFFGLSFGEIMGLVAGLFTTGSIIPQVIQVFKRKSAGDISLLFNILFLLGGIFWLAYGIYDRLVPVIFWNTLSIMLVGALLIGKLKYGREIHISSRKSETREVAR
jgi:MtN3 and saliva related transmembrane protein